MKNYSTFGERERRALDDFIGGKDLDGYEDAVLHRVLNHIYESHKVINRAVIEGKAPESASTQVYQDGLKLAEVIKSRGDAWAAKWRADNQQAVTRARALQARELQPKTFWQWLWG